MRLTGLSWFRGLPPHWAQLTALAPLGIATLLTTIPSTTNSGSMLADDGRDAAQVDLDAAARRAGVRLDQRARESCPAARSRASGSGARVSSPALTVATAFGRFCCSTPVAWPVIDDLFELEHVGLERHVHRRLAGRDGHLLPLVPDARGP